MNSSFKPLASELEFIKQAVLIKSQINVNHINLLNPINIFIFTNRNGDFEVKQLGLSYFNDNFSKYITNTYEIYIKQSSFDPTKNIVYILNDNYDINTLKTKIMDNYNITFNDFVSKTGGMKSKKEYIMYNNKRRLVKLNANNKKYIVYDSNNILLSSIRGKYKSCM